LRRRLLYQKRERIYHDYWRASFSSDAYKVCILKSEIKKRRKQSERFNEALYQEKLLKQDQLSNYSSFTVDGLLVDKETKDT